MAQAVRLPEELFVAPRTIAAWAGRFARARRRGQVTSGLRSAIERCPPDTDGFGGLAAERG